MQRRFYAHPVLTTIVLLGGVGSIANAVPYASSVRNTTGNTWEFILNQDASNVTVARNGGNALNLGALTAGRHTFDMTGFTSFDIKVSNSAAAAWTWVNNSTSLFDDFERPTGMAVNSNPANLAFFGTVYVNNASALTTETGRATGDGLYSLSADMKGIKLSDFSVEPSDTANIAYKPAGWNVGSSNSSAWRLALDDAGNIIVSDWSDANGGMKWANRDFSDGGPLLNTQSGPTFGVENPLQPGTYMHGSIVSKPYVTGVLGTNLTVYGIDEDLESSTGAADGDNIWRWNVGNVKDQVGYIGSPTLVIDPSTIVNQAASPTDSAGTPWFANAGGNFADAFFSPQFNRWYLSGASTYGNDKSSLLVVDATGAQPTVKWSSKQFSIDHNLDGATDAAAIAETAGINDILRDAWGMKMAADGKSLYVILSKAHNETNNVNPYIGPASTHVPGAVLVIPLDANGLPSIQVNDNGTPGTTTDDYITNIQSLPLPLPTSGNLDRVNIDVDAAGNVYASSNITEKLYVFSPGGNTLATTSSNGTFNVAPLVVGLTGDYNNNGKVDAADYVLWRNGGPLQNGGSTGPEGYTAWRGNFGASAGSGVGAGAAVPEPAAVVLLLAGIIGVIAQRRR